MSNGQIFGLSMLAFTIAAIGFGCLTGAFIGYVVFGRDEK